MAIPMCMKVEMGMAAVPFACEVDVAMCITKWRWAHFYTYIYIHKHSRDVSHPPSLLEWRCSPHPYRKGTQAPF